MKEGFPIISASSNYKAAVLTEYPRPIVDVSYAFEHEELVAQKPMAAEWRAGGSLDAELSTSSARHVKFSALAAAAITARQRIRVSIIW